jgi:hypothetical protein
VVHEICQPDDMDTQRSSTMVSGISNAPPAQPVAQPTKAPAQKPAQTKPESAPAGDSVQLSSTAQAMLAAMQEARETPAQTAKEANSGDRQAQKLLASQAAAKPASK